MERQTDRQAMGEKTEGPKSVTYDTSSLQSVINGRAIKMNQ